MKNEHKLKLIKAREQASPELSIGVFNNSEIEQMHDRLNSLYEAVGKMIDRLDIKDVTQANSERLIKLNNSLVKLLEKYERGISVDNLDDIKSEIRVTNLKDIILPEPKDIPNWLARDDSLKTLNKSIREFAKVMDAHFKAPAPPVRMEQAADTFVPFRRVRFDGTRLVFDDKTWAMGGGGGSSVAGAPAYSKDTSTPYRNINLNSTGQLIKSGATVLTGYYIVNRHATIERIIKIYDKAIAPTVGTDTPTMTIPLQPLTAANVSLTDHIPFTNGMGIGATTAIADNDTGNPGANDVVVNIYYI